MWPKATFYEWLNMPLPMLEVYVKALPRMYAHESLLEIRNGIASSGNMKDANFKSLISALRRKAEPTVRDNRPKTTQELTAVLSTIGIPIEFANHPPNEATNG